MVFELMGWGISSSLLDVPELLPPDVWPESTPCA
jgi:hypothetical protein